MLKLKRIELQGFKSFADRSELRFHGQGIAAVVGPNGCGKSNLADAINWVIGEQSAKTLRGARMEDVIFAGTRERKPVGLASVTMTLVDPGGMQLAAFDVASAPDGKANGHANGQANGAANGAVNGGANGAVNGKANGHANGHAASAEREITITRRLFRSGESEYLIDGRSARLRDIQDLFMGTGLGPESYAIIEQGRIGQLLSSRPQDRRNVIEEAAGISRFKNRRRLAEAKLEGAKHNIERVFDILEEVGRQANSLKRQAAKARRYEELKADMNARLRQVLAARYRMLERETARIALEFKAASTSLESLTAEAATHEQGYSRSQQESYQTEAELTDARKRLSELTLELERTRGRLDYQAKQVASIEQRLAQGETDSQEVERRLAGLREEFVAHQSALGELEQQAAEAHQRLDAKGAERDALQRDVAERERGMESARQAVLRLLGEASSLKNQVAQADTYLAALDRDSAKALKEEEAASHDIEWLGASKAEISAKRSARQLELESLTAQRHATEQGLAEQRAQLSTARREIEQARAEFSRIRARRDSLEEILSHRAYTTESVKRLFTAIERGQANGLKPVGVLADFVEVEPSYEKAAEEFLHDELEYIVVDDWNQAQSGIELMRSSVEGRATFLVHPEPEQAPAAAASGPETGEGTGVTARLGDVLRLTNGLSNTALTSLPRLSRSYIASDHAAAQRLAGEYPSLYFLLSDGVCYHGRAVSGGKKSSSGPLALKRELREAKAQVQSREKQIEAQAARIGELERDIQRLEQELERIRGAQQTEEKEAVALDHEMRKLADELQRATSRLSVARLELERIGREKAKSIERRDAQQAAVEEKERTRIEQEHALEAARGEIEGLRAQAARTAEEHSVLRAGLAGLDERRRSVRTAMARVEAQLNELTARGRQIAADLERLGVEKARLLASNIELDRRVAELAQSRTQAEADVSRLAELEGKLRTTLAGLEENLKVLRAGIHEAQENRSRIEVEMVRRQSELKYLDETSRKELDVPVEELATGDETEIDPDAMAEIESGYQEIRRKIEALGPVNPDALTEYQEAQQRYDFLNTQRQDLLDSIRDTERAIQDIDAESKKRFSEAYAVINASFREIFTTLFGGGMAEMRLTDEANIAESGIDIVASPPGKKLQNVLLLSGGEKALTALALLVAIFKYQPSPFCILDEVDAPLDESNVQRLTRLLREMSRQTQVIIITHAKRTMESAQLLYGVTMQEPGVSRLVSVKLNPTMPPPLEATPGERPSA
ncbi:MAG TPA: chromosome segregation protein SMC [Bryobacteraceae bacterium]|nr:chromosome segregation protein SMC [Bryobacteraceae bacterium]